MIELDLISQWFLEPLPVASDMNWVACEPLSVASGSEWGLNNSCAQKSFCSCVIMSKERTTLVFYFVVSGWTAWCDHEKLG